MKKFIQYIVICLASVIVIDLANRAIFSYAFGHIPENSYMEDQYKFIVNDKQSDILIIGASRAAHHYNTILIEDSLKASSFNAGWDGTGIIHNYLSLIKALENGQVKVAIFDVSPSQLQREWTIERLSQVYPFYWKHDSVKSLVDESQPFYQRMWLVSSLVQYNSNYHDVIREYTSKSKAVNGFVKPISRQMPKEHFELAQAKDNEIFEPFGHAEHIFDRMVQLCKRNGTRLILCYSPTVSSNASFVKYLSDYARQKGVEFWNYGSFDAVMAPEYFKDASHLNITGANIFTQEIIKRLAQ